MIDSPAAGRTSPAGSRRPAVGEAGESLAARYLERAGMRILARNWRSGHRELDLVAQEGRVVAFVEVKTRSPGPQRPLEALSRAKRRELRRAAEDWIHSHPGLGREFRFDVVGVRFLPGRAPEIEHIPDAFYADDA
ncbi:MAG: YraN family protein [Gemmatimonadota bacterium]